MVAEEAWEVSSVYPYPTQEFWKSAGGNVMLKRTIRTLWYDVLAGLPIDPSRNVLQLPIWGNNGPS